MDLSTVGGWLACRGAGQYSTRYGKIEDMVVGLEVVLADGRVVRTGGHGPRAATGPDLTQLFVGSEGTLGVITEARLRLHPVPAAEARRAFGFATFADGLEACRRILRRGATPAVLRLYDHDRVRPQLRPTPTTRAHRARRGRPRPARRHHGRRGRRSAAGRRPRLDDGLVDRWLGHRNDVSALAPLWRAGIVVDTVEVAGAVGGPAGPDRRRRWRALQRRRRDPGRLGPPVPRLHRRGLPLLHLRRPRRPTTDGAADGGRPADGLGRSATTGGPGTPSWPPSSAARGRHQPPPRHRPQPGRASWPTALGAGFDVLAAVKDALDPGGILNPGKLGLPVARSARSAGREP